jgi:protein-tyrosine phosphatase
MRSYEINLPGVGNARELGGICIGNQRIKRGVLIRCASLAEISPEAVSLLADQYHLADLVDLRMENERESNPDPEIPGAANHYLTVMEILDLPGADPEQVAEYLKPGADRMKLLLESMEFGSLDDTLYTIFLSTERGKSAYREFFRILAELPEDKAILWHCTDGKDRTGVAAMLLLSALGAPEEAIMEDYLLTNEMNAKKIQMARLKLDQMPFTDEQKDIMIFGIGAVYRRYLRNAMDWMEKEYGSIYGYLEKELLVDDETREKLKEKFLEPMAE